MKNKTIDDKKLIKAITSVTEIVDGKLKIKSELNTVNLLELKAAVSPINNYITQMLTEKFINMLPTLFRQYEIGVEDLLDKNKSNNVNANGYDFVLKDSPVKILAEVKANIPYRDRKSTRLNSSHC